MQEDWTMIPAIDADEVALEDLAAQNIAAQSITGAAGTTTTTATRCPPGNYRLHTVQAGDTLWGIARANNISVEQLMRDNPGVDPQRLRIGSQLCVLVPGTPTTCPAGTTPYTVRRGDSYYLIARRFGISVDALLAANPGAPAANRLMVGDVLCIPPKAQPCAPGLTPHTVGQGESVLSLMTTNNVSLRALEQANPNSNLNALRVGDLLCVPPRGTRGACATNSVSYAVQQGDTREGIAARNGISVSELMQANPNLLPTDFVPGQIVCIPPQRLG